jgi:hypothetical protein
VRAACRNLPNNINYQYVHPPPDHQDPSAMHKQAYQADGLNQGSSGLLGGGAAAGPAQPMSNIGQDEMAAAQTLAHLFSGVPSVVVKPAAKAP